MTNIDKPARTDRINQNRGKLARAATAFQAAKIALTKVEDAITANHEENQRLQGVWTKAYEASTVASAALLDAAREDV